MSATLVMLAPKCKTLGLSFVGSALPVYRVNVANPDLFRHSTKPGHPRAVRPNHQSVLRCRPIGDEVVEMQRHGPGPLSLCESSNQGPRSIHHKHAAIGAALLLGHASWLQPARSLCELFRSGAVARSGGIVVISNHPFRRVAIQQEWRPMALSPIPSSFNDRNKSWLCRCHTGRGQSPLRFPEGHLRCQQMTLRGPNQPRLRRKKLIMPLQLLVQQSVIGRDIVTWRIHGAVHEAGIGQGSRVQIPI